MAAMRCGVSYRSSFSVRPAPLSAQLAAGDQRHRQAGPRLGELGGRLDAGKPVADDQHSRAFTVPFQVVQTLAETQRRRPARDVEGVLGHARDTAVGDLAAERIEHRVVTQLTAALCVSHGDELTLRVDGGDSAEAQPYPGAGKGVGKLRSLDLLAGREPVQLQPLDEVRLGVDHGDLDVRPGQPTGQVPSHVRPGITSPENDDAVLHLLLLSARLSRLVERDSASIADSTFV